MRPGILLVCLVSSSSCLKRQHFPTLVQRATATPLIFSDVRVFDGESDVLLEHQDVVVAEGRVMQVQAHGSIACEPCKVIDGTGKTLMPGLIDAHTHLTGTPAPPWDMSWPDVNHNGAALLFSGITGAIDVGGEIDEVKDLFTRRSSGAWLGPDFIYAGALLTTRGGYPASMVHELFAWPVNALAEKRFARQIDGPEDAKKAVEENLSHGASIIKVAVAQVPLDGPVFDGAMLKVIVDTAHARGVRVVAHIDSAAHAMLAARTGVDALMHGVHLDELTDAEAAELKALGTVVAPTLVVWDRIEQLEQDRFAPTALEKQIYPPEFLAAFEPAVTRTVTLPPGLTHFTDVLQAHKADRLQAVQRLRAAGVPLMAGADDSGSIGCTAGAAFHEELRLLHEVGLTNVEVLRSATSIPAAFFGLQTGVVREGSPANLILVDGNPLDDLAALGKIERVVLGGALIDRKR